jgi:2-desacetyl-2-hydroxyethyl bacteriochlorophyllide A dehydrogenase
MQAKYAVIPEKERCDILFEEIDPDDLADDEILVRSIFSMVSAGTELSGFYALSPRVYQKGSWNAYPWRPGYGVVGEVLAHGKLVEKFKPAERVFFFGKHASLQKFKVDLQNEKNTQGVFAADERLNDQQITASRMGLVGITAPQVSGVQAGGTAAVYGLGTVGNLAAQFYQAAGMRVIGLDPVDKRCAVSRQVGIEEVIDVAPEVQVEHLMAATDGEGVDIAVDAVGHSTVIQTCVKSVKKHGKIVLLGSPRVEVVDNLTAVFRPIHLRWLQVLGALEWRLPAYPKSGSAGSIQENLKQIWRMMVAGDLQLEPLITHVIQPEALENTYKALNDDKKNYLGVLIDWR